MEGWTKICHVKGAMMAGTMLAAVGMMALYLAHQHQSKPILSAFRRSICAVNLQDW
jgi:hypothetical protein